MEAWWVCLLLAIGVLSCVLGEVTVTSPFLYKVDGVYVLEATANSIFSLNCSSDSNHTWQFEPKEIVLNMALEKQVVKITYNREDYLFKSTLTVINASYYSTGNFSCIDKHLHLQPVSVFVKDTKHLFAYVKKKIIVNPGQTVDYLCLATDPRLDVKLQLQSDTFKEMLVPGTSFKGMSVSYSRYRGYTLTNMIDEDSAVFCLVNDTSHQLCQIRIHRPELVSKPKIVVSPNTTVVGDTIELNCTVTDAATSPVVSWHFPQSFNKFQTGHFIEKQYFINYNSSATSLTILNARKADNGDYTCKGVYNGNNYKTSTVTLDIVDPMKPRVIKRFGPALYVKAKYPLTLTCDAAGTPQINFTWFQDNRLCDHPGTLFDQNTKLHIPEGIVKTTEFRCLAENRFGKDDYTYKVFIEDDKPEYGVIVWSAIVVILSLTIVTLTLIIHKIKVRQFKKEILDLQLNDIRRATESDKTGQNAEERSKLIYNNKKDDPY